MKARSRRGFGLADAALPGIAGGPAAGSDPLRAGSMASEPDDGFAGERLDGVELL